MVVRMRERCRHEAIKTKDAGEKRERQHRSGSQQWADEVDGNGHFSFYKFTACTSTLKSINLPHSSRLISDANSFAFECVLVS